MFSNMWDYYFPDFIFFYYLCFPYWFVEYCTHTHTIFLIQTLFCLSLISGARNITYLCLCFSLYKIKGNMLPTWSIFWADLTELSDTQKASKHYSWACLWGHFWERWAFESMHYVKKITLTNMGQQWFNPLRAWTKQNGRSCVNLLPAWVETSTFSHPQTLVLLVLRLSDSDWGLYHWFSWYLRPSGLD